MLRAGLVIVALCSACGAPPDFVTEYGLQVYTNGHAEDPAAMDTMTNKLAEEVGDPEIIREAFRRDFVTVEIGDLPLSWCPSEKDGGCGSYNTIAYGWRQECIAASSFGHEILHLMLWRLSGDPDYEHSLPGLWGGGDSLRARAAWETCMRHCGSCSEFLAEPTEH